ncbi:hypothetical protein DH2020_002942 [Rehmannia glutinosa]|uniref:Sulfotransferase n=1 Tax=Rehmannia glutinosa TaxID=99300 RepID=A0ABR0XV57_REHGL
MAITQVIENNQSNIAQDHQQELSHECKELLSSLPKERGWRTPNLFLYQGFWCQPKEVQAIVSLQKHYKAEGTDLIVATIPKSGITWLKALSFAVVNRQRFAHNQKNHLLLTSNPHDLASFIEYKLFKNLQILDTSGFPRPRLLGMGGPKVLFLKYEDMKENASFHLKKLAEFLGFSFSLQEEEYGIVQGIVKLCSFEHMKELEVNKKGKGAINADFENKNLFRKAEVGDWVNHLTPLMVERLANIMEEKLGGTGLSFKVL